jgi:arginase
LRANGSQTTTDDRSGEPGRGRTATIIGVPLELGASRRGARLGPHVIRTAGLAQQLENLGYAVSDIGDIPVPTAPENPDGGPGKPKNVQAIREVSRTIAAAVERALRDGTYPVIIGGDHSMAVGAIAGVARVQGPRGVIWIDAHPDLNTTATSSTGNVHGMSMAAALGELGDLFPAADFPTPAADAKRLVFIALRDVDPAERQMIREHDIHCFTMSDIDRFGMAEVVARAIEIAGQGPGSVHVSFDIDSLDPALAPGTGTPVPGGITYELSEVNPLLDEHNMTARLAVELICSALGKSIL